MEVAPHNLQKPPRPSIPFKTRLLLALLQVVNTVSRRRNDTVNRRILNLLDRKTPANPKPVNHVKTQDTVIDPSRNLWIRIYTPTLHDGKKLPVVVFFHGGGFVYFNPASGPYDQLCRRFAREAEAVVVSVNYRLSPEYKLPAAYDDGFDVLKYLDDGNALPENAVLSRCFIAGDSAGGNLGHHVIIRASKYKFRELKVVGFVALQPFFGGEERMESELKLVVGFIALQPFFGGEERMESELKLVGPNLLSLRDTDWFWASLLPNEESSRDHWAVNVSGPKAMDMSDIDFPPTIIFIGGFDLLKDWQVKYYSWLKSCGKQVKLVEYPNMIHVFYAFPEIKQSGELIVEMKDFICKH